MMHELKNEFVLCCSTNKNWNQMYESTA